MTLSELKRALATPAEVSLEEAVKTWDDQGRVAYERTGRIIARVNGVEVNELLSDLAAERDALEKQRLKFGEFIAWVREAPVSSGVCCCGDNMADHYRSDHTAYDQWDYSLANWLKELGEQS